MPLTEQEIEDSIRRALLNGEEWRMDDVESKIRLDRLQTVLDRQRDKSNGMVFRVVAFGTPTSEE